MVLRDVREEIGGDTGLTREGMSGEEDSWNVPDRSGTTCSRLLDIRSGQCLFSTELDRGTQGRLEIWNLADDTVVSFIPGSEKDATSIVSIVPPNDKGDSSATFSPDGSRVAFMAVTEETMSNTVGDLYVVDAGDKNPRKLNGDQRYTIDILDEFWVVLDWR